MTKTLLQAAMLTVGTLAAGVAVSIDTSGYVTDTRGRVAKSGTGQCWRTGSWTPALAIAECDPELMPKTAAVAPAPAEAPVPVAAAPKAPAAPTPVAEKIIVTKGTMFDFDKSIIKPAGEETLDGLVRELQGNLRLVVSTGHTDAIGSDVYNQDLSLRRAEAVKAYLVAKGIDGHRIEAVGKGKRELIADNATANGRAQDRRVEIEVKNTPQ